MEIMIDVSYRNNNYFCKEGCVHTYSNLPAKLPPDWIRLCDSRLDSFWAGDVKIIFSTDTNSHVFCRCIEINRVCFLCDITTSYEVCMWPCPEKLQTVCCHLAYGQSL